MRLTSTIGLAFEAIARNKLRSALTSLGIIMGVGAVIVMMALGDGAKASIEQRVASLGTDVITVSAGSANVGGVRTGQGAVTTLTDADALAIAAKVTGIRGLPPSVPLIIAARLGLPICRAASSERAPAPSAHSDALPPAIRQFLDQLPLDGVGES